MPRRKKPAGLGKLIFDASAPGERKKKFCVWRFDAFDGHSRGRTGPFNHSRALEWSHLLKAKEPQIEAFAPERDFEEWEQQPEPLADLAYRGRVSFGTRTKKELEDWFGKDVMRELVQKYGFFARKVAASRVWESKSQKQVAYEEARDKKGQNIICR